MQNDKTIQDIKQYVEKRFKNYGVVINYAVENVIRFSFPKFVKEMEVEVSKMITGDYNMSVFITRGDFKILRYSGKLKDYNELIYMIHVQTAEYEKNSRS